MAAHGWGTDRPLKDLLFEEGYRFDFYQAVKLLEILYPEKIPVGEGSEPEREPVHFKSRVGLEFPSTEIGDTAFSSDPAKGMEMVVNFMGLAGCLGPLPMPYTELILQRVSRRDTAFRDFLDIFNHRLVSLLYRTRKTGRIGFDFRSPDRTPFAGYLYSLIGLGTKGIQGRMRVKDRALLFHTALLAQQPRSMIGLERMLSYHFGITVKGLPFCGQWRYLEADQYTELGAEGQNRILGGNAVVGTRVWDQQGKFEICLGPVPLKEFLDFLPIGDAFIPLCELSRFYVGTELEFDFRLRLTGEEVPGSRLGGTEGARLGWTSWLKTKRFEGPYGEVHLCPRILDPFHAAKV